MESVRWLLCRDHLQGTEKSVANEHIDEAKNHNYSSSSNFEDVESEYVFLDIPPDNNSGETQESAVKEQGDKTKIASYSLNKIANVEAECNEDAFLDKYNLHLDIHSGGIEISQSAFTGILQTLFGNTTNLIQGTVVSTPPGPFLKIFSFALHYVPLDNIKTALSWTQPDKPENTLLQNAKLNNYQSIKSYAAVTKETETGSISSNCITAFCLNRTEQTDSSIERNNLSDDSKRQKLSTDEGTPRSETSRQTQTSDHHIIIKTDSFNKLTHEKTRHDFERQVDKEELYQESLEDSEGRFLSSEEESFKREASHQTEMSVHIKNETSPRKLGEAQSFPEKNSTVSVQCVPYQDEPEVRDKLKKLDKIKKDVDKWAKEVAEFDGNRMMFLHIQEMLVRDIEAADLIYAKGKDVIKQKKRDIIIYAEGELVKLETKNKKEDAQM